MLKINFPVFREVSLGGKNTVDVNPGDRLAIYTPGGGGYGDAALSPGALTASTSDGKAATPMLRVSGSLNQYVANQETV